MYNSSRNKLVEEVPMENTRIWACSKEGCKGWMRDNFAFETRPVCCLCESEMYSDTRMLPLLVNTNHNHKSHSPGVQIM